MVKAMKLIIAGIVLFLCVLKPADGVPEGHLKALLCSAAAILGAIPFPGTAIASQGVKIALRITYELLGAGIGLLEEAGCPDVPLLRCLPQAGATFSCEVRSVTLFKPVPSC